MYKTCYINQPYGLGDIIICEPIARHYYNLGYKIKYWIKEEYKWIQDYIPYVDFISATVDNYIISNQSIFEENYIYLPLIFAGSPNKSNYVSLDICNKFIISNIIKWEKVGWLYDKYIISNLKPELWKTFEYIRNIDKEKKLYNHLNLENKEYILVNEHSSTAHRSLNITSNYEIIKMSNIDGYTMLDWHKVMKNAKEVHTVSTAICYPLIKINHPNVKIYNRISLNDGTFDSVKDIFEPFKFKYEGQDDSN